MKAGKLRHQISILAPTVNRDSYGQNSQIWTPILSGVWASIQQLRGTLLSLGKADATTDIATHLITVRANSKILETHRIQVGPSLTPFDAMASGYFDGLTSTAFDQMTSLQSGPLPLVYTITSILDPDTRGREMGLLCTAVKA